MKRFLAVLLIGMMALSAGAWASGLSIPEQGAQAMGMSASMTARNQDLSAIYYNPAGLDFVRGFMVMLGDTPIIPKHKYSPFNYDSNTFKDATTNSNVFLPPHLYAAWRMNNSMILGVGVNTPFGLGTDWDPSWDGRYNSTFAEITLINVNPTFTWVPTDVVSVGVGINYAMSSATIKKMVDTGASISPALMANPAYSSTFGLTGDGSGYGVNFGVLYKPRETTLQYGLSFRSGMTIDYEGTAKFIHQQTNIINAVTASAMAAGASQAVAAATAQATYAAISANMPAEQDGTAKLNLPWILSAGVKSQMSTAISLSADLNLVGWSVYKDLTIDFADNKPYDKQVIEKDWKSSFVLRTGGSYDMNNWALRGGLMYDFNPVPDATFDAQLPDSDRMGFSMGTGYQLGNMRLDASYLLLKFLNRSKLNGVGWSTDTTKDGKINEFDVPANYPVGNGKYRSVAHLVSVTMSYQF